MLGLIQGQNALKQELFLIRNKQVLSTTPPAVLPKSKPEKTRSPPVPTCPRPQPETTGSSPVPPSPAPHSSSNPAPQSYPTFHNSTRNKTPSSNQSTPHVEKPSKDLDNQILFIGDSISANINIYALESAT